MKPFARRWSSGVALFLGGLLLFHAWQIRSASAGRASFSARVRLTEPSAIGLLLWAAVACACIFWFISSRSRTTKFFAGISATLLAAHFGHVTWPRLRGRVSAEHLYDKLGLELGIPWILVGYAVGITAACVFAHRALDEAWAVDENRITRRSALRWLTFLFLFGVWISLNNALSHFATGKGIFF